jgi:hypothetical protein
VEAEIGTSGEIALTEHSNRHPGRMRQIEDMKERLRTNKTHNETISRARKTLRLEG